MTSIDNVMIDFEQFGSLRSELGDAVLLRLSEKLWKSADVLEQELQLALERDERKQAREVLHQLQGCLASFYLSACCHLCGQLRDQLVNGRRAEIAQALSNLSCCLQQTKVALGAHFATKDRVG